MKSPKKSGTKKGSDEGDGMPPDSETDESENEEGKSVMEKLVLDMVQPWFHTKRILNMDNYYTSPQVFME